MGGNYKIYCSSFPYLREINHIDMKGLNQLIFKRLELSTNQCYKHLVEQCSYVLFFLSIISNNFRNIFKYKKMDTTIYKISYSKI